MNSKQKNVNQSDSCDNIQEAVASILVLRDYLTLEEELQIHRQFRGGIWKPNSQVLWSGMLREEAQSWADRHGMQTLTTAMGPLMNSEATVCVKSKKSSKAWSKYVHGASAVFAWHISQGERVTVLTPPPPQRFHPSGLSYFQTIEDPILRAAIAKGVKLQIGLVHPAVKEAESYRYQLWPLDQVGTWVIAYGSRLCYKCRWRMIKGQTPQMFVKKAATPETSKKTKKKNRKKMKKMKKMKMKEQRVALELASVQQKGKQEIPKSSNGDTKVQPKQLPLLTTSLEATKSKTSKRSKKKTEKQKAPPAESSPVVVPPASTKKEKKKAKKEKKDLAATFPSKQLPVAEQAIPAPKPTAQPIQNPTPLQVPPKPSPSAPTLPAILTPNPPKTDSKVSKPNVNGIIATRVVQQAVEALRRLFRSPKQKRYQLQEGKVCTEKLTPGKNAKSLKEVATVMHWTEMWLECWMEYIAKRIS